MLFQLTHSAEGSFNTEVIERLKGLLDNAFSRVMERVEKDNIPHRTAAMAIGVDKVAKAKATRGLFP